MRTTTLLSGLKREATVILLAAWAAGSLAQSSNTVVVPNSLAGVEGNSSNTYPFDIGLNSTMRYQQVYAASQFSSMPTGGVYITAIAFRLDANRGSFSATLPAVQINLSTTPKAPDGLSATFANNIGNNDTEVFNGALSLSSAASGSPAAFDILTPFTTPFFYNPAAGNLLLDVRNNGGGNSSQFDAVSTANDSVSRGYNPVSSTTGSTDTLGLVTEFVFQTQSQPPLIVVQPQGQSISCGGDASFHVGAAGFPPLSYQWRRNGRGLASRTIAELVLQGADMSAAGAYDVVVSNNYGGVTSAPVALTVVDLTPYSVQVSLQRSNATLAWPMTCASYVLQETPSLGAPSDWTASAMPPLQTNGSNVVALPLEPDARYYRLVSADARADVGNSARWILNGPGLAGRHSGIVATPTNANTLLVSSPGGGVWRTYNGGLTWAEPGNYALGDYSVLHLEWDRVRSGRLYAATYSDLYATTDTGDHWSNLTHFGGYPAPLMPLDHTSDPRPFTQLVFSPAAGKSAIFWSKPCLGLYFSYDGSTFTQTWPFSGGAGNPDNCLLSIAGDDATGYVYFSTMNRDPFGPAHVFRSACPWTATTPCLSWVSANAGLPSNALAASIAYGGSANVLAVALAVNSTTVVYTTKTGTSWNAVLTQPPSSAAWDPRVLVSPAPNQLLLSTVLAYETPNWGSSWNQVWYSGMHPDIRAFYWASFQTGSYLWMTTDGNDSSGTYAAIARWNFVPGSTPSSGVTVGVKGINDWQCYYILATGNSGGGRRRYFMGALDDGCLASDDGTTWTTAGTPPGACGDYPAMAFAPSNPDRAYARTCDGASFARSDNAYSAATCAAVTWSSITPAAPNYLPDVWSEGMIAVGPSNANHVCFADSDHIAVSTDGGGSWAPHSLPGNADPICVFYNTNGDLYVGTVDHGAYKSTDDGVSWTPFGLNSPAPKLVLRVAHSSAGGGEGTFFLATTGGLYRKLPGGSFTLRTGDPSYTVSDVQVDPDNPMRVCAAFGYAGTCGQHRGGVILSTDNGATFTSLTAGLDIHQAPISAIQFDPVDSHYLHAAVFGLGGWTCSLP